MKKMILSAVGPNVSRSTLLSHASIIPARSYKPLHGGYPSPKKIIHRHLRICPHVVHALKKKMTKEIEENKEETARVKEETKRVRENSAKLHSTIQELVDQKEGLERTVGMLTKHCAELYNELDRAERLIDELLLARK